MWYNVSGQEENLRVHLCCFRNLARFVIICSDLFGFGMIWSHLLWFGRIWYDLVGFGMIWSDLAWFGRIWYDLVGFGMIWSDLVWFGRIWSDSRMMTCHRLWIILSGRRAHSINIETELMWPQPSTKAILSRKHYITSVEPALILDHYNVERVG